MNRLCADFFLFNDTATTEIYTYLHPLSLHDAIPISRSSASASRPSTSLCPSTCARTAPTRRCRWTRCRSFRARRRTEASFRVVARVSEAHPGIPTSVPGELRLPGLRHAALWERPWSPPPKHHGEGYHPPASRRLRPPPP